MAKYEIPGKFTAVVKSLNKKMQARVLDEGWHQGSLRAGPNTLQMFFSAMLKTGFHDDTDAMLIRYRTDGKLFNVTRLQARAKLKEESVRDLMFADDCFRLPAMPLDSPSAQRKRRSCFSQHPTQTPHIQPSQSMARGCKL